MVLAKDSLGLASLVVLNHQKSTVFAAEPGRRIPQNPAGSPRNRQRGVSKVRVVEQAANDGYSKSPLTHRKNEPVP